MAELIPSIRRHGLRGGVTYSDGVEDDARYSIAVARTAVAKGATAVTRTRATGLLTADDGRVNGLTVRDLLGGEELAVRAGRVIDATGVWLGHPAAPPRRLDHEARAQPRHAPRSSSGTASPCGPA